MRRSSKINKKRRQSSSSLSAFLLIFALIIIGVLVYYLNKDGGGVSSITRAREPTSVENRGTIIGSRISSNNLVRENEEQEEEGGGGDENGTGLNNEPEAGNISTGESGNLIQNGPEYEENESTDHLYASIIAAENFITSLQLSTNTVAELVVEQENEDSDAEAYEANNMAAFHAIKHKNMRALRQLINSNADIYSGRNEIGYNAFQYAAHRLNTEAMDILLRYENVFNVNSTLDNGSTALHIIAKRPEKYHEKTVEAADFLIRNGADANLADNEGFTPAFLAVENSNFPLISSLITWNINAKYILPGYNYNILHFAMENCKRPIIKALIDYEPSLVNDANYLNRLPIHEAAAFNCVDGLKELILTRRISKETKSPLYAEHKCFADEDEVSNCLFGATPLHFAAKFGKFEATEFLLLIQSQLKPKDEDDSTPIDYAPVSSSLSLYLYEREQWERVIPQDGEAEENIRHIDTRPLNDQISLYTTCRRNYLHTTRWS